MLTITHVDGVEVTVDETDGLQNAAATPTPGSPFEDANDNDTSLDPPDPFLTRLRALLDLDAEDDPLENSLETALSGYDGTNSGLDLLTVSGGGTITGLALELGGDHDSGLTTLAGNNIFLFLDANTNIVLGREGDGSTADPAGDIVFAIYLDQTLTGGFITGAKIWTVLYEPIFDTNSGDSDNSLDIDDGKLFVTATAVQEFDASNAPSGQSLFIMFKGVSDPNLAIVATGKEPADQSSGANISSGDTINTSQVTQTTFGVNNQMLVSSAPPGAGDGIFFTFVTAPDKNFTVPLLDQTEADIEANIQFGGVFSADTASFDIAQLQSGKSAVAKITALDSTNINSGATYVDGQLTDVALLNDGDVTNDPTVEIISVTVTGVRSKAKNAPTVTAEWNETDGEVSDDLGLTFTQNANGSITISGLKAGDTITYVTDGNHNRVLIENAGSGSGQASAAFDVGGFEVVNNSSEELDIGQYVNFEDDGGTPGSSFVVVVEEEQIDNANSSGNEDTDDGPPDDGLDDDVAGNFNVTKDTDTTNLNLDSILPGTDADAIFSLSLTEIATLIADNPGLTSKGKVVEYDLATDTTDPTNTVYTLTGFVDDDATDDGTDSLQPGDTKVFTWVVDSAGLATFTVLDQIDHAVPLVSDAEENTRDIDLTAALVVTDADLDPIPLGDDFALYRVIDDIPVQVAGTVTDTVEEEELAGGIEDEDPAADLDTVGDHTQTRDDATGSLTALVSVGTDEDATFALAVDNTTAPALVAALGLTSGGKAVDDATVSGDTLTAKDEDGNNVFTLKVEGDGKYTFTLLRVIDHAADNAEDLKTINLGDFVQVTDFDGDAITLTAAAFKIRVIDDVPGITDGTNPTGLMVDESAFGTDDSGNFSGLFSVAYGADGAASSNQLAYSLGVGAADSGLDDSLTGLSVLLSLEGGSIVGRVNGLAGDANIAFVISVNSTSGLVTLDQRRAVIHTPDTGLDQLATLADGVVTLTATATDGDGDSTDKTVNIGDRFTFKDDAPAIAMENIAGSGTVDPQIGYWTGNAGADGLQSISIHFDRFTVDGNAAIPVDDDLDGLEAGPDGSLIYSGSITADLDGEAGDETLDFTLTLRMDGTYVFDLDGGFGSSVTFSSADGSLDAGGPDPVRTLSFPPGSDEIVFFGVQLGTTNDDIFDAIGPLAGDHMTEAEVEAGGFAFLGTADMNVSTSGIGVGNNNLDTGEAFVINPNLPVTQVKVFIDNSVAGYDPSTETLTYTIFYEDGTTTGPIDVNGTDVVLTPVTSGVASGGLSFEINAEGSKQIDAVRLTMVDGKIKIPVIEFTQNIANIVDPVYFDFTATITDKDGDSASSSFSVAAETDPDPQNDPDITLVDTEMRLGVADTQPDAFNVDLALGHDAWLIQGFDAGTDTLVLLNPLEGFSITPVAGDYEVDVGSTKITIESPTGVVSAADVQIAVAGRIIDDLIVGPGNGGVGDDALIATGGGTLTGGDDADSFVFADTAAGGVTIADFDGTEGDRIVVSVSGFGVDLEGGVLSGDNFALGAAGDGDDYFIFNAGELSFDADGNGAGAAVTLATLTGAPALTADDIFVIG